MRCNRSMAVLGALAFGLTLAASDEPRIWKTKSGATAEASYVSESSGMVALRKQDGSMVQVSRATLSPEDDAYLKKVQYKPKSVTVSFAPSIFQGHILFGEVNDKPKPKFDNTKDWRRQQLDKVTEAPDLQQPDTLCFRVMSEITGEWGNDSTWNVLSAEVAGKSLTGNAEWKKEKKTTDGKFIRVAFKLTNSTKDEQYVSVPSLVDMKGRKVEIVSDSGRFIEDKYKDPHLDKLPPGFTRTYCAIYEVADDAEGFKLMVPTLAKYNYHNEGTFLSAGEKAVRLDVAKGN